MPRRTERAIFSFSINVSLMVIMFIASIYIGVFLNNKRSMNAELQSRGRSIVDSIILVRNWNANYGGVYVEKKPGMVSNPYLHDPDFAAADGRVYTLKNPALMTREISELNGKDGAFEFRITSLKPLNPDNAPDIFEREALVRFERGGKEAFTKEVDGKSTFFRYMVPLPAVEHCLACHDDQERIGEVRGGISVRFNIDAVEAALTTNFFLILGLALVTLGSLLAVIYRLVIKLYRRLKETEAKLRTMSITDDLTGLHNRRYLFDRLETELKRALRHRDPLSCIMFDLDHFKLINDTHGHEVGDTVLRLVADAARSQCRETDILSRYGGEEFLIVLPHTGIDGAIGAAERLRQAIMSQRVRLPDGRDLSITASFGVAEANPSHQSEHEEPAPLLRRVDQALYKAKANGRNRVEKVAMTPVEEG